LRAVQWQDSLVRRAASRVLGILAICAVITIVVAATGSPTTPMSFPAAIVTSLALPGAIAFFAGRAYLRRKRPFRLSPPTLALLLTLLWLGVAFVFFDWFYNGY
jgi:hypothetical protein